MLDRDESSKQREHCHIEKGSTAPDKHVFALASLFEPIVYGY
jgi:hypothetical protein